MEYIITIYRTCFFYFFIAFVYRIMGKREVGQLGIIDLIVTILIAELVAISLADHTESMFLTIIPIFLLVALQVGIAFISLKNKTVRDIFDGKPSVIVNNGKIKIKEMLKQRYNLDDLLTQLREEKIQSLSEVKYAILETSGKLSVFKKDEVKNNVFPLPIIVEGKVDYEALRYINKDILWLKENIKIDIKDIFYAFYKSGNIYLIKTKDLENNSL